MQKPTVFLQSAKPSFKEPAKRVVFTSGTVCFTVLRSYVTFLYERREEVHLH